MTGGGGGGNGDGSMGVRHCATHRRVVTVTRSSLAKRSTSCCAVSGPVTAAAAAPQRNTAKVVSKNGKHNRQPRVQTRLYSLRLDCSIVSLTAANTNRMFSVSVAHVKCE